MEPLSSSTGEVVVTLLNNVPTAVPVLFKDLPDETIVAVLQFLRATDLVAVSEVDRTVFHKSRIERAIHYQLQCLYSMSYAGTPMKEKRTSSVENLKTLARSLSYDSPGFKAGRSGSEDGVDNMTYVGCDMLYVREIKCILAALQSPQPISGKGYWISASWIANAKKYFEALPLPEMQSVGSKKGSAKKQSKIRQRRGSDALPPWPSMTADITCIHNSLALTKGARAKKRIIDSRAWFFLRKFYPEGPQFKSTRVVECAVCEAKDEEVKASVSEKREAELRTRRTGLVSGALEAVAMRKSGVPSHLTPNAVGNVFNSSSSSSGGGGNGSGRIVSASPVQISEAAWLAMVSVSSSESTASGPVVAGSVPQDSFMSPGKNAEPAGQPLLPGLYNLVPKQWLKSWRQFTKDPTMVTLPPLDCTCLLCHTHGQLVIPPHFEEYIVGLKRSLLGGLGEYQGQVFEVLSADEWDALQNSLRSLSDFGVRFCLDGHDISWSTEVCLTCDSYNYGPAGQAARSGHF